MCMYIVCVHRCIEGSFNMMHSVSVTQTPWPPRCSRSQAPFRPNKVLVVLSRFSCGLTEGVANRAGLCGYTTSPPYCCPPQPSHRARPRQQQRVTDVSAVVGPRRAEPRECLHRLVCAPDGSGEICHGRHCHSNNLQVHALRRPIPTSD